MPPARQRRERLLHRIQLRCGLAFKEAFDSRLHKRNACRAAHQHKFVDLLSGSGSHRQGRERTAQASSPKSAPISASKQRANRIARRVRFPHYVKMIRVFGKKESSSLAGIYRGAAGVGRLSYRRFSRKFHSAATSSRAMRRGRLSISSPAQMCGRRWSEHFKKCRRATERIEMSKTCRRRNRTLRSHAFVFTLSRTISQAQPTAGAR